VGWVGRLLYRETRGVPQYACWCCSYVQFMNINPTFLAFIQSYINHKAKYVGQWHNPIQLNSTYSLKFSGIKLHNFSLSTLYLNSMIISLPKAKKKLHSLDWSIHFVFFQASCVLNFPIECWYKVHTKYLLSVTLSTRTLGACSLTESRNYVLDLRR
jgi:hypothetical protein